MKGFFITFEGIEGTGKSTQAEALYDVLKRDGLPVYLTHEPGGTKIGDRVRELLLNPENGDMDSMTEILLYAASRAQLVAQVLRPYLEEGYIVICDRFVDSSIAYQAFGRSIPVNVIRDINSFATWNVAPDITFYMDLEPEVSLNRIKLRVEETENLPDRLEREKVEFFRKVRDGYHMLMSDELGRFRLIDASLKPQDIHEKILSLVARELRKANLYFSGKTTVDNSDFPFNFSID